VGFWNKIVPSSSQAPPTPDPGTAQTFSKPPLVKSRRCKVPPEKKPTALLSGD
jgi:hypothetical protein